VLEHFPDDIATFVDCIKREVSGRNTEIHLISRVLHIESKKFEEHTVFHARDRRQPESLERIWIVGRRKRQTSDEFDWLWCESAMDPARVEQQDDLRGVWKWLSCSASHDDSSFGLVNRLLVFWLVECYSDRERVDINQTHDNGEPKYLFSESVADENSDLVEVGFRGFCGEHNMFAQRDFAHQNTEGQDVVPLTHGWNISANSSEDEDQGDSEISLYISANSSKDEDQGDSEISLYISANSSEDEDQGDSEISLSEKETLLGAFDDDPCMVCEGYRVDGLWVRCPVHEKADGVLAQEVLALEGEKTGRVLPEEDVILQGILHECREVWKELEKTKRKFHGVIWKLELLQQREKKKKKKRKR